MEDGEEDLCDGRIILRDGEKRRSAMKIPNFLEKKEKENGQSVLR